MSKSNQIKKSGILPVGQQPTKFGLSVGEGAESLGIHPNKMRELISSRQIGHFTCGRRILIPPEAILEYRQRHYVAPVDAAALAADLLK